MTQADPSPDEAGGRQPGVVEGDVGAAAEQAAAPAEAPAEVDVESLEPADLEALATDTLDRLEAVTAERDDYLGRLQRLQADFENYKKRAAREHQVAADRATGRMAEEMLPVLDSCDAALLHGADAVEPVFAALLGALEKQGLERIDPFEAPFDPEFHEAVMHEHGDEGAPVVVEVLRPGYVWKDKVLRAAMVKVRG